MPNPLFIALTAIAVIASVAPASIEITELMASNRETLADADGDYPDWVEIANRSDQPQSLEGYFLSDDVDRDLAWAFPARILPPGEHLIVFASGKDRRPLSGELHTNFRLDARGGSILLSSSNGPEAQELVYPRQFADVAYGVGLPGRALELDFTPSDFSQSAEVSSQVRVSDGGGGTFSHSWDSVDTTSPGALHQRYLWFDYSAALSEIPAGFRLVSAAARWTPRETSGAFGAYETLLGLIAAPGPNRGAGAIFPSSDGSELTRFFASSGTFATAAVSSLAGPEELIWDATDLVQSWVDAPESAERGQFVVINRDDPVFVRWPAHGPSLTAIFSDSVTNEPALLYFPSPTPGAPNASGVQGFVGDTKFSVDRGFKEEPFTLEITSATEGASIAYTTDGSEPSISNGTLVQAGSPDAAPVASLQIARTTVVRAKAIKAGYEPSNTDTQTYLFMESVLSQPRVPAGFPASWTVQPGDYEMDPRIVGGAYPEPEIEEALRSLPTVSVVLSLENLFDPATGIYSHPQSRGDQWERAASVEFIDFPSSPDAQFDCGLRINGRASRSPNRGKHNMRLAFRERYGPVILDYPVFGDDRPSKINSIVLRGNNGDSWVNPGTVLRAQYIRDQWHRDAMEAMGHEQNAQGDYHLYINGLYWGLYHLFERMEGDWGEEHWGGDETDYDVVKDRTNSSVEAVSGNTDAWNATIALARRVNSSFASYTPVLEYVDPAHLADYIALNFFSGNGDWATSNWRAIRRREAGATWHFICHDSERTDINSTGASANDPHGPVDNNTTGKNTPNMPDQLHQFLARNPEYRMTFADRVHRHFFNGGPMSPDGARALWNRRAERIRSALKAESARWGDRHRSPTATPDNYWQATLDYMNESFFGDQNNRRQTRTEIVLGQLRARNLYPDKDAPEFSVGGAPMHGGRLSAGQLVGVDWLPGDGDVLYTLDGSDPRLTGGLIAPGAREYTEAIDLRQSALVSARVYDGSSWSALSQALFLVGNAPTVGSLVVAELHYHPAEGQQQGEFIEIQNTGEELIDLSGVHFTRGVIFSFPVGTTLVGGGRIVVDGADFQGETALSNGGERIELSSSEGEVVFSMRYDDDGLWARGADGRGESLLLLNPSGDPSDPLNWRSAAPSPGQPDPDRTTYQQWRGREAVPDTPQNFGRYASGLFQPGLEFINDGAGDTRFVAGLRAGADDVVVTLEGASQLSDWQPLAIPGLRERTQVEFSIADGVILPPFVRARYSQVD